MGWLRLCKREDGMAMVMVFIIMALVIIIATAMLNFSTLSFVESVDKEQKTKARSLAEAGVAEALAKLPSGANVSGTLDGNAYSAVINGSGPYTVVGKGVLGPVGNQWTSTINTNVELPYNITSWNYALFSHGTMDFDGNSFTIVGPINSVGAATGSHVPGSITHDDIDMPEFAFNTGLTPVSPNVSPSTAELDLSTIAPNTTFFTDYTGPRTLKVQGPTATNVCGIIKAQEVEITGNDVIGSPTKPFIIWASKSVTIKGDPTFYGLIYVNGPDGVTQTDAGTPHIYGMVITSNNASIKGNATIAFDAQVRQNIINMHLLTTKPIVKTWQESYTKS